MKKLIPIVGIVLTMTVCLVINFLMYNLYYPLKYQSQIILYAEEYQLDEALICAIINTESSFEETAVSNKGAIGLMQIMPSTAKAISEALDENFDVEQLFSAETNIKYGCYYLSVLLKQFEFEEALCAYNAGPSKVRGWLKNSEYSSDGQHLNSIPYSETRNYVEKVKKNIKFYQNKFN